MTREERLQTKVSNTVIKKGVVLSNDQRGTMYRRFTCEDVRKVLFDIEEIKALGPDGYTSGFFKKAWHYRRYHNYYLGFLSKWEASKTNECYHFMSDS